VEQGIIFKGDVLMHRYALAPAFILALATPGLAAEFFVALDTATNQCRVVTERPDDGPTQLNDDSSPSLKMVGSGAYKSEAEAQKAIQAITECQD
jgi:hypothetical protein